jgi:tetratricopeptide (TPR) repeat protein
MVPGPPSNSDAALAQARHLIAVRRLDDAISCLRTALASDPANPKLLGLLGGCEVDRGNAETGLQNGEAALAIDPENLGAHLVRSLALLALHRSGDACAAAHEALRIAPHSARALDIAARCELHAGRPKTAMQLIENAVAIEPHNVRYLVTASQIALKNRRTIRARQLCLEALRQDPQCAPALNNLGASYQRHFQFITAYRCYRRAIQTDPQLEVPQRNLWRIFLRNPFTLTGAIALAWLLLLLFAVVVAFVIEAYHAAGTSAWGRAITTAVVLVVGYLAWRGIRSLTRRLLRIDPILSGVLKKRVRG